MMELKEQPPVVSARSLSFERAHRRILSDLSFDLRAGAITGLLGTNGAGKSTLIKLILGLLKPAAGTLTVLGQEAGTQPLRVGYLPENVSFYDQMSVKEHLFFFAKLKGVDKKRTEEVLEKLRLTAFAQRTPRECSKGQRQRLGLAQALLTHPDLLLLDEPTTGLDPQTTEALYSELLMLKNEGCSVLVCTHELALAENFLDAILMLQVGKLVAAESSLEALRLKAELPVEVVIGKNDREKAEQLVYPVGCYAQGTVRLAPKEVSTLICFLTTQAGIFDFDIHRPDLRALYAHFNRMAGEKA